MTTPRHDLGHAAVSGQRCGKGAGTLGCCTEKLGGLGHQFNYIYSEQTGRRHYAMNS